MGRKKMEEYSELELDVTTTQEMRPVPKKEIKSAQEKEEYSPITSGLVNCLRNEKVTIKHINKPNGLVNNPKHVLFGGMAETAKRTFVTPILSSGAYKNVLTDDEKAFLEDIMGLEYNALSIYKKKNNYWSSDNPAATVELGKNENYLDLSNPEEYIKYKILLANNDYIAPSLQELQDRPKATYQFVIISDGEDVKQAGVKLNNKMICYKELGKLNGDTDTLRVVIETLEGKPTSPDTKYEFLEAKADEYITSDSRLFLKVIQDPMLSTKVLIKKSIEAGLLGKRGNGYYLKDGTPLCEMNEEPTLSIACRYLNAPKHQETKFMLEAKLK